MPTPNRGPYFVPLLRSSLWSTVVISLVLASGTDASAESLTGVTKVKLNAAVPKVTGKILTLENVRVKSNTTNAADYVSAEFKFDAGTFQYNLQNATVYRGVGVFALNNNGSALFAKDAPEEVALVGPTGKRYGPDQYFKLNTAGETFTMDLTLGQVISFIFGETNDSFTFEFRDPTGHLIGEDNGSPSLITVNQGGAVDSGGLPILQSGRYTVRLTPKNKPSLAVTVGFLQGNRRPLAALQDGGAFSGNLTNGLTDYAKYSIALNQGDVLTMSLRTNRQVSVAVVLPNSQIVSATPFSGGGIANYQATTTGIHYLFIYNDNSFDNGSFSGSVKIAR